MYKFMVLIFSSLQNISLIEADNFLTTEHFIAKLQITG